MFKGIYNGRQCHAADIPTVLSRAWSAGIDRIIVMLLLSCPVFTCVRKLKKSSFFDFFFWPFPFVVGHRGIASWIKGGSCYCRNWWLDHFSFVEFLFEQCECTLVVRFNVSLRLATTHVMKDVSIVRSVCILLDVRWLICSTASVQGYLLVIF